MPSCFNRGLQQQPALVDRAAGDRELAPLRSANVRIDDEAGTITAALEAKGFRRVAGIEDILPKLGAKGRVAMVGYVFDAGWASANEHAVARSSR